MARVLHGSCLCGATLYIVADDFKYALICHCSQCRRATGSAFKPFGGIERFHLKVKKGRLKIYGDVIRHNAHCITCGSLLYSIIEKMAHVTYGTLLDAPTLQPQAHIFVGSKAPWDVISDSLPQHVEFPPKGRFSTGSPN